MTTRYCNQDRVDDGLERGGSTVRYLILEGHDDEVNFRYTMTSREEYEMSRCYLSEMIWSGEVRVVRIWDE